MTALGGQVFYSSCAAIFGNPFYNACPSEPIYKANEEKQSHNYVFNLLFLSRNCTVRFYNPSYSLCLK